MVDIQHRVGAAAPLRGGRSSTDRRSGAAPRSGFDLGEEDGYAIVSFGHLGWERPGPFMAHCTTKWATFLMSLKQLVETGTGAPAPHDVQISNWH